VHAKIRSFKYIIAINLFIISFSFFGIYRIYEKADLPLKFSPLDSFLVVKENKSDKINIHPGDTLISIDEKHFASQEEIEVFLDGLNPGVLVQINFLKNNNVVPVSVELERFYTDFYVITALFTGLMLIFIGIFVLWKRPESKPAILFNLETLGAASIIMMTWGHYNVPLSAVDYGIYIIFLLSYSLAPAFFVHFTLSFPREKKVPGIIIILLYASAAAVSLFSAAACFNALSSRSVPSIQEYLLVYNYSRFYSVACIISGLIIFIHSYVTARNISERKRIRWILLGFFLGPLMYAGLWVIPQAITDYGLVPEEVVVMLMLFVPVTFAIAILKHHIFDIDLIIQRSLVYFLSIGILILVYAFIISILTQIVKDNDILSSGAAAVIIALLFQPAKDRVQKIIDKRFFRIKYDFRIASKKFLQEIKNCNDIDSLAGKITDQIKVLIPVKKQGFFLFSSYNSRIYLKAGENFDKLKGRSLFLDQQKLKTNLPQPVALKDKIEPGTSIEEADNVVFKRWDIALIFPVKSSTDQLLGFLVLGDKRSGGRFTIEDLDLLIEVCVQAGLTIERIQVQEKLVREQLLKEKLQELNELKSFFLSSVSHELKTPLTSIRMFAEFLHMTENLERERKEEYLEIIEGECDRLGRLIENILDLSKLERGTKEFLFSEIDIKSLLMHTISLMSYQAKIEDCQIITSMEEDEYILNGDRELIQSALINLLSNGIKYSAKPKKVYVNIEKKKDSLKINFENSGSCLSHDELLKVREPFYRGTNVKKQKIPGSGIGLALVSQIMSIHNGELLINNIPDNGFIFTLSFPREKCHEKNINC
jgi:signal transduction histidine kinase